MGRHLSTTLYPERLVRRASPGSPVRLAAAHSFISSTSSISFTSIFLRTLLHNGHSSTPLQSILYVLFLSRRRVYPSRWLSPGDRDPYSLPTTHLKFFLFTFLRTLLHISAFFCTHQKLNSLVFNRFRTLCKKPPGVRYPPSALPEVADKPQLFCWASGRSFLPKAGSIDRLLGCI